MREAVRLVLAAALVAAAASAHAAPAAPSRPEPLGLAMEGYPYPFPVSYLPLELEGQDMSMAFMDVAPSATPNGRAVLLLHGKNFFGAYWEGTIRVLAGAGFRVVVPDQIGFAGASPPSTRGTPLASALTYQMIYSQPVVQDLPRLRLPTLLVIGQADRTALGRGSLPKDVLATLGRYPDLGRKAAAAIPGAKLVELAEVGHVPHLESPARFHAALLEFLR